MVEGTCHTAGVFSLASGVLRLLYGNCGSPKLQLLITLAGAHLNAVSIFVFVYAFVTPESSTFGR